MFAGLIPKQIESLCVADLGYMCVSANLEGNLLQKQQKLNQTQLTSATDLS